MANNVKPITMDSNTFEKLKNDMTVSLNRLLTKMQAHHSEEAEMNVKLTVKLNSSAMVDGKPCVVPVFKHKVVSTVQMKEEEKGSLDGRFFLDTDGNGGHVLKLISSQTDMFEH